MNTAIITGATGGLGRNLTERLAAEGWRVVACGRNAEIGASLNRLDNVTFHAFDLSNLADTLNHFQAADVVFHCAALSSPWGAYDEFYCANVIATQNVIAAVREYPIGKLVHVSTPSIYFDYLDQHRLPETHITRRFVNNYAYTKYLAELAIQAAKDINSVIIRPRGIFGEHDTAVLPRLQKIASKGYLPLLYRAGRQAGDALIDVSYVGNVVEALLLAYQADTPRARAYNITNGEPCTVRDLYTQIIETLNWQATLKPLPYAALKYAAKGLEWYAHTFQTAQEPLFTQYSIATIAFDQTLDIARAERELGYAPKWTIAEGLNRLSGSLPPFKTK